MNPTPGRMVHYVARGSADGKFPCVCRSAIITEVSPDLNDPYTVGLAVLNPTGLFFQPIVDGGARYSAGGAPETMVIPTGAFCTNRRRLYPPGSWHEPERAPVTR